MAEIESFSKPFKSWSRSVRVVTEEGFAPVGFFGSTSGRKIGSLGASPLYLLLCCPSRILKVGGGQGKGYSVSLTYTMSQIAWLR